MTYTSKSKNKNIPLFTLNEDFWVSIRTTLLTFFLRISVSLLILYATIVFANYASRLLLPKKTEKVHNRRTLILDEFASIVYYLIVGLGCVFAIINLGIQSATILTIVGTLGLTIGLAIQGVLNNVIAGLYLGFSDIFEIGDTIDIANSLGESAYRGKVQSFTLFNTVLLHPETNTAIVIPNYVLQQSVVTNTSTVLS